MFLRVLLVTLFVLLSSILIGVAGTRACYLCNSYTDNDHTACLDPMEPYPYVNYTYCPDTYVCTKVSYSTQKIFITSRGCDPSGDTCNNIRRNLQNVYPDLSSFSCYSCLPNYCNSAPTLKESQIIE